MDFLKVIKEGKFKRDFLFKKPFAVPSAAAELRKLVGWPLLLEIFKSGHADCWLARKGELHAQLKNGRLDLGSAQNAFNQGYTVVVRHSEKAHSALRSIAGQFSELYNRPVDIQLYCTPPGEQGFDWHYDLEDVFVFQSSGVKEFSLRANLRSDPVSFSKLPRPLDLSAEAALTEQRCLLKAGDFLYIPSGYWHCARAVTPSFHLSVGVALRDG